MAALKFGLFQGAVCMALALVMTESCSSGDSANLGAGDWLADGGPPNQGSGSSPTSSGGDFGGGSGGSTSLGGTQPSGGASSGGALAGSGGSAAFPGDASAGDGSAGCQIGLGACKPDGTSYSICDATGNVTQAACTGGTPFCLQQASAPTCVACFGKVDCPASTNDCLVPACDASHACAYDPKPQGTACEGGTGHCDGAGQCDACTPGSKTCNGDVPLQCASTGHYTAGTACAPPATHCDMQTGTCVECSLAADCPVPTNGCLQAACVANKCSVADQPDGTACSVGADPGACQAAKCEVCTPGSVRCNVNRPQVCGAEGQWHDDAACGGSTPYCSQGACVATVCGNGVVEGSESCDGRNLQGNTCSTVTLGSRPTGTLACTAQCGFDTSRCTSGGGGVTGAGGGNGAGGVVGAGGGLGAGGLGAGGIVGAGGGP